MKQTTYDNGEVKTETAVSLIKGYGALNRVTLDISSKEYAAN